MSAQTFCSSHRRSLAAVAAFVATACVSAVGSDAMQLLADQVGEFHSQAGESLEPFLGRVGASLHAFSKRTQFEACGMIASNAEKTAFAVLAFTNRSHIACLSDSRNVPAGMRSTDVTIHSHPTEKGQMVNRSDRIALSMLNSASVLRDLHRSASSPATVSITTDGFSPADYTHPGYLACSRGLLYQSGPGTDRLVAAYPTGDAP